ncbi:MAG TPA: transporter [Oceanospirillaceae bacterium]|mgnify:CR=1 FL=1|nr:transporter [Oceanospirillaceae bacterium]
MTTARVPRLHGLDLARYLAFIGMVIVNFSVVMGAEDSPGFVGALVSSFQGRAAATFVVLAGVGLGLSINKGSFEGALLLTSKRALFLFIVGLINMLVFPADILHYYAFYFFFGILLTRYSSGLLWCIILALNIASLVLIMTLDFEQGWNFATLDYLDFWQPAGFVRNLFFNGWHPVIPWLGFFLFGLILSRMSLSNKTTQVRLLLGGSLVFVVVELSSQQLKQILADNEALTILVATDAMPAMPLYTIAGMSMACIVISLCLMLGERLAASQLLRRLSAPGKQTLTLYIAHILIGMGILDTMGMLAEQQTPTTALTSALLFSIACLIYANLWQAKFSRGPLEGLMRKLTG